MALIVEGPLEAEESWGGVGGPFCFIEMDAWALLRLRLAMVAEWRWGVLSGKGPMGCYAVDVYNPQTGNQFFFCNSIFNSWCCWLHMWYKRVKVRNREIWSLSHHAKRRSAALMKARRRGWGACM